MGKPDLGRIARQYLSDSTLDSRTDEYLGLIGEYNSRVPEFRPGSSALVVIDMQRCFLEPDYPLYSVNGRVVLPRVVSLVESFRSAGRPVIFATQCNLGEDIDRGETLRYWWTSLPREGSRETELVDSLSPRGDEKVIPKRRYSAFFATDLELTLRTMKVSNIVVCGVFTNVCVEATVRDGFMRDFFVFLPADAIAALNEELHTGSLRTQALWFAKVCKSVDITSRLG